MATERIEKPDLTEIATTRDGRDITRGYIDALPQLPPTDRVLHQVGGYEAYEELLRDDQVLATFSQRRMAVLARPWRVTPGGTKRADKLAAQLVEQTVKQLNWDTITDQMLYARHYGLAVAEVLWDITDGQVRVQDIRVRDRQRFAFAPDRHLLLMTTSNPNGERVPERKFWVATVGASHHDEPYGIGLGQALYWPVWFKRNGAKFWAVMLEKFGQPTPVGKFPMGTDQAERNYLLQAVQAVATDSGIIIPESVQIDLLEATRSGSAGYEEWMHYWDGAIAKIVLGQTMTTEDGSSYSQASVHYDVRQDLVKADADLLSQSANGSWVKWLVEYNFPDAALPTIWRDMEDAEDTEKRSARDKTLFEIGYKLKPEAVSEVYGEDYEPIQAAPAPVPSEAPPADTKAAPAQAPPKERELQIGFRLPALAEVPDAPPGAPLPILAEDGPGARPTLQTLKDVFQSYLDKPYVSPVEPMAARLDQDTDTAWRRIFAHVEKLVQDAQDLGHLRDQLLAAYSDLPVQELANVMALGLAAAELAGRYDVMQESGNG